MCIVCNWYPVDLCLADKFAEHHFLLNSFKKLGQRRQLLPSLRVQSLECNLGLCRLPMADLGDPRWHQTNCFEMCVCLER